METRFLQSDKDGQVVVFTETLAARDDMVEITSEAVKVLQEIATKRKKRKTREETAMLINSGICEDNLFETKHQKIHFGKQELKRLLDFIYGEPPRTKKEEIDWTDRK